ncbi:hypothetical protein VTO73DRAFT_10255 [Trametes versicolor]
MDVPEISKRKMRPSHKLLDPSNAAQHEVVSHQLAADAQTTTASATTDGTTNSAAAASGSNGKRRASNGPADAAPDGIPASQATSKRIRTGPTQGPEGDLTQAGISESTASMSTGSTQAGATRTTAAASSGAIGEGGRAPAAPLALNADARDSDGLLMDVEVIDIDESSKTRREDKGRDADHFFGSEVYHVWAKANDFMSMLPRDTDARRKQLAKQKATQSTLTLHLREKPPPPSVVKYTNALFRDAAIEWLIATDQPIQALEHPAFRNMIDIAARATDGVRVPNRKQTRRAIIETFKRNLTKLRERLNSDAVKGLVSLTCDAWQASNTDGYFAVMGHWIEESPSSWASQSALLGFVRLNNAHNGVRLGHALYKVVARVGIESKVGYITCDNAKNNRTMLDEFATQIEKSTGKPFDAEERYVRCLAHIINLATQALLGKYSKSLHYDPTNPDVELAVNSGPRRDEIGLVRSISVKERSSAKRKELFKQIQSSQGVKTPHQLLLDSPTRWSSTYVMLDRAERLHEHVDQFVYEIGSQERDRERRQKLLDLQLSADEWARVKTALSLLAHADNAQQAFSSDQGPTLHLGLPALEALHKAWSSRATRSKYAHFESAIDKGLSKVAEYYDKTSSSDVYTLAMILDPSQKKRHLERYWGKELSNQSLKRIEKMYKERYLSILAVSADDSSARTSGHGSRTAAAKVQRLARELSDDEDDSGSDVAAGLDASTAEPWLVDFNGYLNSPDQLGKHNIVQWWGVNEARYPVWASLAQDYLAVMASSVSSERAFSSAGITISKRRNRLKGDIVEALQALKCMIHHDLLFREEPSPSAELDELDSDSEDTADARALQAGPELISSSPSPPSRARAGAFKPSRARHITNARVKHAVVERDGERAGAPCPHHVERLELLPFVGNATLATSVKLEYEGYAEMDAT